MIYDLCICLPGHIVEGGELATDVGDADYGTWMDLMSYVRVLMGEEGMGEAPGRIDELVAIFLLSFAVESNEERLSAGKQNE